MHSIIYQEIFSHMVAFSRNLNNEKTVLFATIEERPKFFMLNLHNFTINILGRKVDE